MTGQEVIKKNPAAERGANVVGCNWVLKIVNGETLQAIRQLLFSVVVVNIFVFLVKHSR